MKFKKFEEVYSAWRTAGSPSNSDDWVNIENIYLLAEWVSRNDYHPFVEEGYQFPLELWFDAYCNIDIHIALDYRRGRLNAFPPSDFISPNIISFKLEDLPKGSLRTEAKNLVEAVRTKVIEAYGL